ncbi:MAG: hypothetical protein IPK90_08155 [Chitinophagaceae bacterium]|nr:hypothetical protein [Chitinophagaceae bacterium]
MAEILQIQEEQILRLEGFAGVQLRPYDKFIYKNGQWYWKWILYKFTVRFNPGTMYFVRAYATNIVGTSYGGEISFTTQNIPSVTTNSVTSITSSSAICGGNVVSNGGTTVTSRGICWSTTVNPTIANSRTINGSGSGPFSSAMTGLLSGRTYYVRAYAANSWGTAYGSNVAFTTN